ncbi:hypothetical protein G6O69_12380 [Pseudenhygromyxa sp. WMMC2535]|uniref:ClpXP protease specificity-enhancing factor SspB n=1 Tax=Pseudenhygromyxa sp. WMMC2535 TaxID=2712867 RepID=UPI0015530503|nr:ClpXP protease specificity-enhancing factor SspB [Pseudenhygromyxa sp. WMMC2535]NVB38629.1 hypothetical protein [Pseudenhygromyxa sp. WMMC2535]
MHPIQRAIESLHENERCPRLHVDVTHAQAVCPDFVREQWKQQLVIDLDPSYPLELAFTEVGVEADLSFGGYVTRCVFPWDAIYVVVDRETGRGLVFEERMPQAVREQRGKTKAKPKPKPKPGPKLVVEGAGEDSGADTDADANTEAATPAAEDPTLTKVRADTSARRPRRRKRKKTEDDAAASSTSGTSLEAAEDSGDDAAPSDVEDPKADADADADVTAAAADTDEQPEIDASEREARSRRAAFKVIGGGGGDD